MTTLLAACVPAGCTSSDKPVSINFIAQYQGQPVTCAGQDGQPSLTDLRFFLHAVSLVRDDGVVVPANLVTVPGWQSADVALVDLESAESDCRNGSSATHTAVSLRVPDAAYTGLRFSMSVPEHLNHADPLQAEAPLTQTPMHWHWRSGYKFLRAGIQTATDAAWIHLGSARCNGSIGNLTGCDAGNRPEVWLPNFDPDQHTIAVELSVLFPAAELADGIERSCQMGPDEPACRDWLPALGLNERGDVVQPTSLFQRVGQ